MKTKELVESRNYFVKKRRPKNDAFIRKRRCENTLGMFIEWSEREVSL